MIKHKKRNLTALLDQMNKGRDYIEYLMPELKHRVIVKKSVDNDALFSLVLPHGTDEDVFVQHVHLGVNDVDPDFFDMSPKEAGENLLYTYFSIFVGEISDLNDDLNQSIEQGRATGADFDLELDFNPHNYIEDSMYLFQELLQAESKSEIVRNQFAQFNNVQELKEEGKFAWTLCINASPSSSAVKSVALKVLNKYTNTDLLALSVITVLLTTFSGNDDPDFAKIFASFADLKTAQPRKVPLDAKGHPIVQLVCDLDEQNKY